MYIHLYLSFIYVVLYFFVRRYDTIQDAILVCALKLTKVSLIYHT